MQQSYAALVPDAVRDTIAVLSGLVATAAAVQLVLMILSWRP